MPIFVILNGLNKKTTWSYDTDVHIMRVVYLAVMHTSALQPNIAQAWYHPYHTPRFSIYFTLFTLKISVFARAWYGKPYQNSVSCSAVQWYTTIVWNKSTYTVKTRFKTNSLQRETRYYVLLSPDWFSHMIPCISNLSLTTNLYIPNYGQLLQTPLYLSLCSTTTWSRSWPQLYVHIFLTPSRFLISHPSRHT